MIVPSDARVSGVLAEGCLLCCCCVQVGKMGGEVAEAAPAAVYEPVEFAA
jgi:hypothetical protein